MNHAGRSIPPGAWCSLPLGDQLIIGTTLAALQAGNPLVVDPQFYDVM